MSDPVTQSKQKSGLLARLRGACAAVLPARSAETAPPPPAKSKPPLEFRYSVADSYVHFDELNTLGPGCERELALAYAYRWFLKDDRYISSEGAVTLAPESVDRIFPDAFSSHGTLKLEPVREAILRFSESDEREVAREWASIIADVPLSVLRKESVVGAMFDAVCERTLRVVRTESPSGPAIFFSNAPIPALYPSAGTLDPDLSTMAACTAVLRRVLTFLPQTSPLGERVGRGCEELARSTWADDGDLRDEVLDWVVRLGCVPYKRDLHTLFDGAEPPEWLWDMIPAAVSAGAIVAWHRDSPDRQLLSAADLSAVITAANGMCKHPLVDVNERRIEIRWRMSPEGFPVLCTDQMPSWARPHNELMMAFLLCGASLDNLDRAVLDSSKFVEIFSVNDPGNPVQLLIESSARKICDHVNAEGLSAWDHARLRDRLGKFAGHDYRLVELPPAVDLEAVVLDDTHPLSMGPVDHKGLRIPQNDADLASVELLSELPDAGTIPTAVADASLELLNAVQSSGSTWRLLRPTSDRSLPVIAHKKCGAAVIVPMHGLAVRDPISGRWMSTTGEIDVAGMLAEARATVTSTAKLAPECVRAFVWFLDAVELCDPTEGVVTGKASDVLTAVAATLGRSPAADEFLDDSFQRFYRQDEDRPKPTKRSRVSSLPKGTAAVSPAGCAHPGVVVLPSLGKGTSKLQKEIRQEWDDFAGREVHLVRADDLQAALRTLNAEFPHLVEISTRLMEEAAHQPHVRFRPLLLVGKPGAGKSHYAKRVGEVLGTPWKLIPCGGMADGSFGGTSQQWNSGRPSVPLATIRQTDVANPLLILDELEKAGQDRHNGSLLDVLLAMLEPSTSTSVTDPYLEAPVDLSHVTWIATVNHLDLVPGVLYDRFRVIEVPEPGAEHLEPIARSMVRSISTDRGIPEAWVQDLDGFELRAVADVWKGGSLRKLRRVLEAVLTARDKSATRH